MYANGQARAAQRQLGNLADSPGEAHDPELGALTRKVQEAIGGYNDGVAVLATDIKAAERHWTAFWAADKEIMPPGDQSALAEEAHTELGKQYYKMGKDMFDHSRLVDAYQTWDHGDQMHPGDTDLQQGFFSLEHSADELLQGSPTCDRISNAVHITRPTSFNHKRATALLRDKGCH